MTSAMTNAARDPALRRFNALPDAEARARLLTCLDVPRCAEQVSAGRPYAGWSPLEATLREAGLTITDDELTRALARHPRIGERAEPARHEAAHSEREQSGIDPVDQDLGSRLREGNLAYEERFGRVFLIRAAGRDGHEILGQLRLRLGHTDEQERAETIEQLLQIAVLRLEEVLT